ncbi:hypothetical protein [Kineococcus sp. SYSU DK004]|uniref:hypothetical protein n=1 Tax=Kineococcus sp. SYSU DK004 TaxID=3383125 RepID=UPI003D7DF9DD
MLQDPSSGYEAVADVLWGARPLSRRFLRRHELCVALNDVAAAIDPATYAGAVGQGAAAFLVAQRVPGWAAYALTGTAVKTLLLASGVDPGLQLRLVLRALIVLVCPGLEHCPTCAPVCSALASPEASQQLRFALAT